MRYIICYDDMGSPSIHHYVPNTGSSEDSAVTWNEVVEELVSHFESRGEPERALLWRDRLPKDYFKLALE